MLDVIIFWVKRKLTIPLLLILDKDDHLENKPKVILEIK